MWQRLQQDHNLVIGKETVRHVLRIVDPEGVEQRSRHRLRRRKKGAKKKRREKKARKTENKVELPDGSYRAP